MLPIPKVISVDLCTAKGSAFSCLAEGVEIRTVDVLSINPQTQTYLTLSQSTQITALVEHKFLTFELCNAAASLQEGRLTVIAEKIRQVPSGLAPSRKIKSGLPLETVAATTTERPSASPSS